MKKKWLTIILIIIIVIAVGIGAFIVLNKKNENGNKEVANTMDENKTNTNNTTNSVGSGKKMIESLSTEEFPIEFLKLENEKQNMIYSPLSIKYAFKMLNEGAGGNTKKQLDDLIGDLEVTKYENIDKVLSLANSVFIRDDYAESVKESFKEALIEKYNAEVRDDSFENADTMNEWIEEKTLGLIKKMIPDELIQYNNTKMVLINALAINMKWNSAFDRADTYGKEFYLEDGTTMNATMMRKNKVRNGYSYYQDDDVTVLTGDLEEQNNAKLEFVAVMPDEDLQGYIEENKMEDINSILEKTTLASEAENGINISIPRFSFDYNLSLKEDMRKLGITDAFDQELADFSNMTEANELYVGDALHKANIEFSEEGIKASAATAIIMMLKSSIEVETNPKEIIIDKPFLFFIRDKETKEVWFTGTVYEPNSWENDQEKYKREY